MNAECNNTAGSYTCRPCFPGFIPGNLTFCGEFCLHSLVHKVNLEIALHQMILSACFVYHFTACTDGNIRLMNGTEPSVREGRVEICYNNAYGSICDDFWDIVDAGVVCRQLRFNESQGTAQFKLLFSLHMQAVHVRHSA